VFVNELAERQTAVEGLLEAAKQLLWCQSTTRRLLNEERKIISQPCMVHLRTRESLNQIQKKYK
jgi:hypothetical protein